MSGDGFTKTGLLNTRLTKVSRRAQRIAQAEIRAMSVECERAGGVNLAQGICDTEAPAVVREAARAGIENGVNSYTRFDGLRELRHAIADKLRAFNRIIADPETEITVSAGSTGAFYAACLALLDPGDEVILFEPFYGYHTNTLLAVEAAPVYVTTRPPQWSFSAADLERAASPRTRAIMVNTPANPSGKVFTREELEQIAEFAQRHDLIVFTDEIYEHFLYDGRSHVSPASLPGFAGRTVTISGYSKTFSITGWRVGYSVAPPAWAEVIGGINDLVYVCAPAPLQYAVAAGIRALPEKFYANIAAEYAAKRDRICHALLEAGLPPSVPQGAYYVLADAARLPGATSKEKAMYLLSQCGIATVPGEAFFHAGGGENLLRFCFAKSDLDLDEACRRLQRLRVTP